MKLGAVILAAGLSTRMGGFKPLLELDGQAMLLREIGLLLSSGLHQVVVVSGNRHEDVCRCLSVLPQYGREVQVAHNREFEAGMFSSVLTGVRALAETIESFYLLPADCPGVTLRTLLDLGEAMVQGGWEVVYPVVQGRRGHPPLISCTVLSRLEQWQGEGGLKAFLRTCEGTEVAVEDRNILNDLDTPTDLLRFLAAQA